MIEDLDNELWRPIYIDGVNSHDVSNLGRIKSIKRKIVNVNNKYLVLKPKLIKQHINADGYLTIVLKNNNKSKGARVHRLVAEAWIDNPYNKATVNHKNGVKTDNRVENLEWATQSENVTHCFRVLGRVNNFKGKPDTRKHHTVKVKCDTFGITFPSLHEASVQTGCCENSIIYVCKGKILHTQGIVFRYV